MAGSVPTELPNSAFVEELEVLKAIYDEDIKVLGSSSSQGEKCEFPLKVPQELEVKIDESCYLIFRVPEGYPAQKPEVKVKASSMNSILLEEDIKSQFKEKEDNYLYEAIELAKNWFCHNATDTYNNNNANNDKKSEKICKFFKEGKCRFGENCFNKHPGHEMSAHAAGLDAKSKPSTEKNEITKKSAMSERFPSADESLVSDSKKQSMKTATDVISRIQWDDDLPTEDFIVGYIDRFIGIVEKSFNSFSWEDIASVDYSTLAIPKHRIQYFKYKDTVIWDKRSRLDKVFGSTGNPKEIYDIIRDYKQKSSRTVEDSKKTDSLASANNADEDGDYTSSEDENECANQTESKHKRWTQKDRPNFFFCFKITNNLIKQKILSIQEEIVSCNSLLRDGCLKESEFHVTLCMVRLESDEEKEKAIAVLNTMQQILVCMLPTMRTLNLEKLGSFRGRVLHIQVQPDPVLSKFVNILLLKLKDAGLHPCGNRDPYCPHVTILKLSRAMCHSIPFRMIDPNYYQHHILDKFGTQAIEEVYLCSTRKQRTENGFYVDIGCKANSLLCLSDKLPNAVARTVSQLTKDSILTESEGDDLLQALLSEDEKQFETAVHHFEEIIAQNPVKSTRSHMVFIMRGLQGSGKSFVAKHYVENTQKIGDATFCVVCSADEYFERNGNKYGFNPSELADAHKHCRMKFINAVNEGAEIIVLDNTNSRKWEYQIFERIAKVCGYSTHIIEIACKDEGTVKKFIDRCQHKVDKEAVYRLWNQWEADYRAIVIDPMFGEQMNNLTFFDLVKSRKHSKSFAREVLYSGLFLDDASRVRLLNEYPPLHAKCTGNHMTFCYKPMREEIEHIEVGKTASVSVIGYICNDLLQVVAVKEVEEARCSMEVPHITISHSKKAAPHHAKLALQNKSLWQKPEKEILLTGKIGMQVSTDRKNSACITDSQMFKEYCREMDESKQLNDLLVQNTSKATEKVMAKPVLQLKAEDITSLYVFDFDSTLFKTPGPVTGRNQYLQITGERWPHKGWIGRPESLQWPLQIFPGPSFVDFKEHLGRAGSLTVLLTGRLQRTFAGVSTVLKEFGVHPELCLLKPDDDSEVSRNTPKVHSYKKDVVRRLLKEYPKIKEMKLWDDRQDNVDAFRTLRKEYKNVHFEIFKVSCKEDSGDRKPSATNLKVNEDEFNKSILQMIEDYGFGCSPSFDAAVKEGISFIEDAWLFCLELSKGAAPDVIQQFGSYPLMRSGDVDLCLLAPASLRPDECIFKLEAELLKRGVRYVHTAAGIRCPRLKLRLHYSNAAPVDFDIVFAPCLQDDFKKDKELQQIYENGENAVKLAVEGLLFLEKVRNCIKGKVSIEKFGKLVDLIIHYLKTKHLKGNAFHCVRTFHVVRSLAEMFSKTKDSYHSMGDLVRKSFEHLATVDAQHWQRICKEFVPEETIQQLVKSFISGSELVCQSEPSTALFASVQFPPGGHEVVSVTVSSHVKELQWRASVVVEAKLGTCIRKMISAGVDIVPGPSDYDGTISFAIPSDETSFRVAQHTLANLRSEGIFLANKKDLTLMIQIGNSSK